METWLKYINVKNKCPYCHETDTPLHCTLKYDKRGEDQEFTEMWEEMEQGQVIDIKTLPYT